MAEAQEIMAVPHQIVSPQSNAVLVGLVQDSLVGGYLLSAQDTFFTREQAMQLLCQVHHDPNDLETYRGLTMPSKKAVPKGLWLNSLPHPAIVKPRELWTGKQLFSCLLPKDISFSKVVRSSDYLDDNTMPIVVRRGQLVCGRLCKATLGTSGGGFVQSIWKLHGAWAAAKFVSDAQRILVRHVAHNTVCISVSDAVQSDATMTAVREIVQEQ